MTPLNKSLFEEVTAVKLSIFFLLKFLKIKKR
jgi:hypothetical protein